MRISDLLKREGVTFSLEVFPPKTSEKYTETAQKALEIARLNPDFMSVYPTPWMIFPASYRIGYS